MNITSNTAPSSLKSIRAFHGSPGVPEDFNPLKSALAELSADFTWTLPVRLGYPGSASLAAPTDFALGYSWGCFDCLEYATTHPVRAVILIAPYLYPTSTVSPLKRLILSTPIFSDLVLQNVAPKAIQEFLVKSSAPQPVPADYLKVSEAYTQPKVLRAALLEKNGKLPRLQSALEQLNRKKTPILLILGDRDESSEEAVQVAPLREKIRFSSEKRLADGGHALLWTHPRELAKELVNELEKL
jgi:pimeloyl-ACP methyl ester carboxylesterase